MLSKLLALSALVLAAACSKAPSSIEGKGTGIIGGADATGDEDFAKSIVALVNVTQGSICTASILSEEILVTAAHCVDGPASSLRVLFGKSIEDTEGRIIQAVVSYQVSPLWPTRSEENFNAGDIAVVRFAGGLPAGYKATKVLANDALLADGATVMLAGYGLSDGVKKEGAGKLRYVETTIQNSSFSETEILIEQSKGKGACHGDSGGPAYVKVNGEWALWGVTNRGVNDPNDHCSVSAAYAKVTFYRGWILQTAKKLLLKQAAQSEGTRVAANQ